MQVPIIFCKKKQNINNNFIFKKIFKKHDFIYKKNKDIIKKVNNSYYTSLRFGIKYFCIDKHSNIILPYKIKLEKNFYLKKNYKKLNTKVFNKKLVNFQKKKDFIFKNNWFWPTYGKIIENFSYSKNGNKGIDIIGLYRQPIFATASGIVVYTGNSIKGYGNLIIIKHNNNYLSAYAYNDKILVKKKQNVKANQKIAVMGITKYNSVRLHFELRYKGESVNPLNYLPPQ